MKITKCIIPLVSILLLTSCAYEKVKEHGNQTTTRDITVKDFSKIKISGKANIHFTQSGTTEVELKCDAADMDKITIQNYGNTLVIKQKDKKGFNLLDSSPDESVDVLITSPNLRGITINGSGNFYAKNDIDTDMMKMKITGSGNIHLDGIICNSTDMIITGSGNTNIKRLKCGAASTKITGSGDIDIENMQAGSGVFVITGSGELDINNAFINNAICKISGSGNIGISGNVKTLKKQVYGSGEINISK